MDEPFESPRQTKPRSRKMAFFIVIVVFVAVIFWLDERSYQQTRLNASFLESLRTGTASEAAAMLAQGADPNAREKPDGHDFDMLEWLKGPFRSASTEDHEPQQTALILAAGNRNGFAQVKMLVEHGADVHATGQFGMNALVSAALGGNLDTVKYLQGKGLSVNSEYGSGRTVLQAAVESKSPEVVRYLISAGANVNAASGPGTRPLNIARELHREDIVDMLVKAGAK